MKKLLYYLSLVIGLGIFIYYQSTIKGEKINEKVEDLDTKELAKTKTRESIVLERAKFNELYNQLTEVRTKSNFIKTLAYKDWEKEVKNLDRDLLIKARLIPGELITVAGVFASNNGSHTEVSRILCNEIDQTLHQRVDY